MSHARVPSITSSSSRSAKKNSEEIDSKASSISSFARAQGPLRATGPVVGLGVSPATERLGIQPKLTVNEPGDKYEKEAERVADAVMRMSDPAANVDIHEEVPSDRIQRMCPRCRRRHRQGKPLDCEECEAELQRKESSEETSIGDAETRRQIQSVRDGGRPLPNSVRSFFGSRFGRDFSDVRVHTGSEADEAAQSINAKAFTAKQDIVFRSGAYRPQTQSGKKLLAHELTHVVQQTGGWSQEPSGRRGEGSTTNPKQTGSLFGPGRGPESPSSRGGSNAQRFARPRLKTSDQLVQRTCEEDEEYHKKSPNYCLDDTFSPITHSGKRCYREVIDEDASGCPPGEHVCFDDEGKCEDSPDDASIAESKEEDGSCNFSVWCIMEHTAIDFAPAILEKIMSREDRGCEPKYMGHGEYQGRDCIIYQGPGPKL